jgi:uncharacterized protein (UPF0261 family)
VNRQPVILIIGTVDTKSDEIAYLRERVEIAGGRAVIMDVGVLGRGGFTPDISNAEVAHAAGVTLQQVMETGDENMSMIMMARGATLLATQLRAAHQMDGLLALGGTMGTDLALDVANALPLGCPKVVLSTIAYSHLIPADRVPPDLIMRLWAGGLYGLNRLCKSALAQAAGAVVGACIANEEQHDHRPMVGMTSLGSSALSYMKKLKPALEARGYELAVFHTTGMGGRAFESLAAQGKFVAVMDFSLQELVNELAGSSVTAGANRLMGAGTAGTPQIVAPGATDMVDYPGWGACPVQFEGRPLHAHNRLISSVLIDEPMRRTVARTIGERLGQATGRSHLLIPVLGVEQWDREGEPLHDPAGLSALMDELPRHLAMDTEMSMVEAHINDATFVEAALAVFDAWVLDGTIPPGVHP